MHTLAVRDALAARIQAIVTRKVVGDFHKQLKREMDYAWRAERWTYLGIDFDCDRA